MIYTYIYTNTYDIRVHMILPKHALIHMWYGNYELICLQYVSHSLRYMHNISNENIFGCK